MPLAPASASGHLEIKADREVRSRSRIDQRQRAKLLSIAVHRALTTTFSGAGPSPSGSSPGADQDPRGGRGERGCHRCRAGPALNGSGNDRRLGHRSAPRSAVVACFIGRRPERHDGRVPRSAPPGKSVSSSIRSRSAASDSAFAWAEAPVRSRLDLGRQSAAASLRRPAPARPRPPRCCASASRPEAQRREQARRGHRSVIPLKPRFGDQERGPAEPRDVQDLQLAADLVAGSPRPRSSRRCGGRVRPGHARRRRRAGGAGGRRRESPRDRDRRRAGRSASRRRGRPSGASAPPRIARAVQAPR